MTRADLVQAIATYEAGLEAELTLLRQVVGLSASQRDAGHAADLERLQQVADERTRLMASLVALEHELKPVRASIAKHRALAETIPGFPHLVAAHRAAGDLVATIMTSDRETLAALKEAEVARRFAAQAIEAGENTLAAYRRVVTPRLASASLIDKRG